MICSRCVKPDQLKKFIDIQGQQYCCQYCHKVGVTVENKFLFDYILDLVDKNVASEEDLTHYELGLIYECGADFVDVQSIDIILSEWFDLGDDPYFDDLLEYVPEHYLKNDQGNERHYFSDEGNLELNWYEEKWEKFTQGVKHTHRFFNPNAKSFLDSVFSLLWTNNYELKPEVVRSIVQGEEIYRARTVVDRKAAKKIKDNPHSELGLAPKSKTSNQRMTPSGIPALYCALERETCLSEIRSITGDLVVSGAMTPINQLKLLDLTKMDLVEPPKLTLFDDGFRDSLHLKTFLKSLVKKLSKPKVRNDELSYLSTQIVFEYLRLKFGQLVDGLVIPSVQTGEIGTNVVLFPESCVISAQQYIPLDEFEQTLGANPLAASEDPFSEQEKLMFVANSLRYHRVTAIETRSKEYDQIHDLFMSDLTRKQPGLPPL